MEIGRILELAGDDEKEWYKTFESLVRPRRAATGLRYCRLASRYLTWFQGKEADAGCSYSFFDSDMIWHYLKDLCSEGVGRFTPKSTVHALQFFAEAFGCKLETGAYKRVREIAEQHSRAEKPPSKAPMFPVAVLTYLEDVTTKKDFSLCKRRDCSAVLGYPLPAEPPSRPSSIPKSSRRRSPPRSSRTPARGDGRSPSGAPPLWLRREGTT